MKHVCTGGWIRNALRHPEVVLSMDAAGTNDTSHGMCPPCKAALDAELARLERQQEMHRLDFLAGEEH